MDFDGIYGFYVVVNCSMMVSPLRRRVDVLDDALD